MANRLESLQHVGAAVLWLPGPRAQTQELWFMASVALWEVVFCWTGDHTCVSCIGRQIIHHGASREDHTFFYYYFF